VVWVLGGIAVVVAMWILAFCHSLFAIRRRNADSENIEIIVILSPRGGRRTCFCAVPKGTRNP
jgi:hypothetical protein